MGAKAEANVRLLHRFLQPGDGVIDVGANIGRFTERYAAVVGESGQVIGIEPDPESLAKARTRTAHQPQVEFLEAAVGDVAGERVLHLGFQRESHNSLWKKNITGGPSPGSRTVQTVTLDSVAARVRQLRGIKIDTQGAECLVLRGATETLRLKDLVWQVEVWPFGLENAGDSVRELIRLFDETGWHPRKLTWHDVKIEGRKVRGKQSSFDIVVTR